MLADELPAGSVYEEVLSTCWFPAATGHGTLRLATHSCLSPASVLQAAVPNAAVAGDHAKTEFHAIRELFALFPAP